MESKEYFEKVMQDYNQNRKERSLRKYCKDEAVEVMGANPVQEELSFTGETPETIARCFHTSYHNF